MKVFREKVRAFADYEAAIVGAVREKVDETLEAAEAWLLRILILMWPGLVLGEIGAVWEAEIDSIK